MGSDLLTRKHGKEFDTLDIDDDGFLTEADFERVGEAFAAATSQSPGSPGHETILARYRLWWAGISGRDGNGDGRISREEWLAYDAQITADEESYHRILEAGADELFKILDTDGDGAVSQEEYATWLGAYGVSAAAAQEAFAQLDVAGSGRISQDQMHDRVREFFRSEDPKAPGNWLYGRL